MTIYRALASVTLVTAVLLIYSGAVALSHAEPPPCNPTPHVSWPTSGLLKEVHSYRVSFGTTCGLDVAAAYHANHPPFGTSWLYGNTVKGRNVASQLDRPPGIDSFCTYGYRYRLTSGWHNKTLGGPGC